MAAAKKRIEEPETQRVVDKHPRLEALVQTRFQFKGKPRVPGDVMDADELADVEMQTLNALVSQKHIILRGEGEKTTQEEVDELSRRVVGLEEDVARLRATIAQMADTRPRAVRSTT